MGDHDGTSAAAQDPGEASTPLTRDQLHARDRAAFLAEDGDGDDAAPPAKKPVLAVVESDDDGDDDGDEEAVEDADADDSADESDDDESESDESDDEEESDDSDESDEEPDAETSKRLDQVRRTDKRLRERREADFRDRESKIQGVIAEWTPRIEKAEKLEQRLASLARNPFELVDLLREIGMPEDDFEAASQTLFAHSKKFADDPKAREVIAQRKRDRAEAARRDAELAELRKRQDERDARDRAAAEQAAQAASAMRFVRGVEKAADAETFPLAAAKLAKNPKAFREQIADVALKLWDKTGAQPTAKRVLAAFEKQRRAELAELDIELPAKVKKTDESAAPAKSGTGKPEKKKTEPKSGDKTTADKSDRPATREEILREMAELERSRAS